MRYFHILPLIALMAPAQVQAQDAREEPPVIVVTGAGLPLPPGTPAYGSQTIDRDRLIASGSGGIESVLADVAGFQQFRRSDSRSANPSAQGATLRALGGNASSRALVLLDGVPMADPFFGYIPFNAIAPDRLSSVRVTRGGGAGAFGAGAVAGTIELVSAIRADLPRYAASAYYGSHDATSVSAETMQDLGRGYVSVSGRWDRGDGFQTTPEAQRVAATVPASYDAKSINIRAVAPLADDMELQFRGLVFRDKRTLRFAGADSRSEGQDASIRLVSRGPWQVDALAYVQARNFSNVVIAASPPFQPSLDQRDTPSTGIGGKLEIRPPVGPSHMLRLGSDTRFSSGDMFEDAFGAFPAKRHAGGRQNVTGLFLEDDWKPETFGGRLTLTGGVRADHWSISGGFLDSRNAAGALTIHNLFPDRDGWQASVRTGIAVRVSQVIALRSAAYSGFRLPTLNELYRPFVVSGVRTTANAALGLEKLKGAEVGFDITPAKGLVISGTAFYNRLGNAISNVTIGTNLRQRQNVHAIVAKGAEINASARIGAFDLSASYAYSHAQVDAPGLAFVDGLVPAQSPRHAANGALTWTPQSVPGAMLSASVHYVSRQYEDDLQTDALRGAVTLDANARLPIGHGITLVARCENITDTTIITRNAAGSIDLGTPRTFWFGVRIAR